jgi:Peroxin-3
MSKKEREEPDALAGPLIWETFSSAFFANKHEEPKSPLLGTQLSEETERKFLLTSWWLTHRGWRLIGLTVQQVVEESLVW